MSDIREPTWARPGTQEGVGEMTLCDLPAMMAEHDDAHREEIEAWAQIIRSESSGE
jgi:hypothetical protein